MKKITFFTSSQDINSFKEYLEDWKVSPNLSNQNFYNKLIHSLALSYDVDVVSVRSINKNFKHATLNAKIVREGNIFWKYPLVKRNRVNKRLHLYKRVKKITMQDSCLVFVDTLNLSLLENAIKYAQEFNMKVIGVCTDSPNNISFISDNYKKKLIEKGRELDGYIVLTEKINDLYNPNNKKPYICIDGVNTIAKEFLPREIKEDYIYFGGSLMKEYGVLNLIEAFKKLERNDLKLVICGHHLEKERLHEAMDGYNNIIYLGPVDYERNLSLEKYSLLTVNPRPINPKIDDYSFPSKTLEFLSSGCLTVAVSNEILKKHYDSCVIWAKSGDPDDLLEAMNRALELNRTEREMLAILGKNKVMQYTSLESVNRLIETDLLSKFSLD